MIKRTAKIKKVTLIILLSLLINMNAFVFAKDNNDESSTLIKKVSTDTKILEALKLMKNSPASESYDIILGKNPTNTPIKIKFKDLSIFNLQYSNFDALGWKRGKHLYIYINQIHKNAPTEAICALVAGRAINQDTDDSINEEIYIWTLEAVEWNYFLKKNPSLAHSSTDLVKRENALNDLYKRSDKDAKYIKKVVLSTPFYNPLGIQSPGFSDAEFKFKMDNLLSY